MPISAIENHTRVMTPTGHEGTVRVTRRERKLIDKGERRTVSVLGTDGVIRRYGLDALVTVDLCEDETEE